MKLATYLGLAIGLVILCSYFGTQHSPKLQFGTTVKPLHARAGKIENLARFVSKPVFPTKLEDIPAPDFLSVKEREEIVREVTKSNPCHVIKFSGESAAADKLTVIAYQSLERYANDPQIARGRSANELTNEFSRLDFLLSKVGGHWEIAGRRNE